MKISFIFCQTLNYKFKTLNVSAKKNPYVPEGMHNGDVVVGERGTCIEEGYIAMKMLWYCEDFKG